MVLRYGYWHGQLIFLVVASTEDRANARFLRTICPLWQATEERFGIQIREPKLQERTSPAEMYRYQYLMIVKRLLSRADMEAHLPIPDPIKEAGDLPSFDCSFVLIWLTPDKVGTWEEATQWAWKMFDPPIAPDFA